MWNLNIGREFERQMKKRISDHPEILHKWNKGHLIVYHQSNKHNLLNINLGIIKSKYPKTNQKRDLKENSSLI